MNTPISAFRALMAQEALKTASPPAGPLPDAGSAPKQAPQRAPGATRGPGRPRISPDTPLVDYHVRVPAPLFVRLRMAGTALVRHYLEKFTITKEKP